MLRLDTYTSLDTQINSIKLRAKSVRASLTELNC